MYDVISADAVLLAALYYWVGSPACPTVYRLSPTVGGAACMLLLLLLVRWQSGIQLTVYRQKVKQPQVGGAACIFIHTICTAVTIYNFHDSACDDADRSLVKGTGSEKRRA